MSNLNLASLTAALILGTALGACGPSMPGDSPAFTTANDTGKADGPLSPTGPFAVRDGYPIVLHHGFNASPDSSWGWNNHVKEALEGLGHKVFISQVNPYNSPEIRGPQLEAFVVAVLNQTGASKVHIIAHSQGGLDARYLVSPNGLDHADQVASLTTISTPHHGTYIADVGGSLTGGIDDTFDSMTVSDMIASLMARASLNAQSRSYDFDLPAALQSMAESLIENDFNGWVTDAPSVYYQSVAGVSSIGAIRNDADVADCDVDPAEELAAGTLRRLRDGTRDKMTLTLDPVATVVGHGFHTYSQDGVVRVTSSRYGRFRGCILADHMGVVGQGNDAGRADAQTGFDVYTFYAQLAAELVREHQQQQ